MPVPNQITLYRLVHVETLETLLTRGVLHAPNWTPDDGLPYRTIHDVSVQVTRTRVGPKYLCVVVVAKPHDAFVLTCYLTDTVKKGDILWPRSGP